LKKRPLFWHYPHYSNQGAWPGSAVRLGKYKLIDNFEKKGRSFMILNRSVRNEGYFSNPARKARKLYKLLTNGGKIIMLK
jgi:hypothetical protein